MIVKKIVNTCGFQNPFIWPLVAFGNGLVMSLAAFSKVFKISQRFHGAVLKSINKYMRSYAIEKFKPSGSADLFYRTNN
jgi:hypothetical protein